MVEFDFTVQQETEKITFGNSEKKVTIDISFISSSIGFEIKKLMFSEKDETYYSPKTLSSIIGLFTSEVTPEWIAENCDYGTLDQITAKIYHRAFGRRAEKNT